MTGWIAATRIYLDRRVLAVLVLGFSSGLPFLLVFGTLSFWLKSEGVSLAAIGIFSLVRTPYTFKFLWAPLIDRLPLPVLTRVLGRRRGWTLFTQFLLMLSIWGLASTSPAEAPLLTALMALAVAFFSASQDVVIDAYRIEMLEEDEQGAGAGALVFGYRMGLLTAGAGALLLNTLVDWSVVYGVMGGLVAVGMVAVLMSHEPEIDVKTNISVSAGSRPDRLRHWLQETFIAPLSDFARRRDWVVILGFIMLYKLGDAYLGVMANPFYIETGFTNEEIAAVSKVFGLGATLIGALIGGVMVLRFGILRTLLYGGVLQMLSNVVFAVQAAVGHDVGMLIVTIGLENLSGAMATTAFVAYLSSLCSAEFTASQYALLTSFMAFARDILSASSGVLAENVDWVTFFVVTTVLALPGLLVLMWLMRRAETAPLQSPRLPDRPG
ncbi:MAG: AmpG family muropeptide MFS transporter [Proteobacteria bacterium]|nr:AmpG family muropeptide MFS transporter [Pseudomonadota bacterium]